MKHWYEDHAELCTFMRALARAAQSGQLEGTMSLDELVDVFEKPWKWTDEYEAWVAAGRLAVAA